MNIKPYLLLTAISIFAPLGASASYSAYELPEIVGSSDSQAGYRLASGDLNGDGYDDVVVSSLGIGDTNNSVYIMYGQEAVFADGAIAGEAHITASSRQHLGIAIAVGDLNGDGYDDVAMSSTNDIDKDSNALAGVVYVVYGGSTELTDLNLDSTNSSITTGPSNDTFGTNVAIADLNGDGAAELLIGDEYYGSNSEGAVYIRYGTSGSELSDTTLTNTASSIILEGRAMSDNFSDDMANVGDVNQDGYEDVAIAAPYGGASDVGHIYLLYGQSANFSGINRIDTVAPRFTGEATNDRAGSVSNAGDINDDGYDDFFVGVQRASSNTGRVYVIFGKSSTYANDTLSTKIHYSGILVGSRAGHVVAVTDTDADGYSDMAIGTSSEDYGYTYVVTGDSTMISSSVSGYPEYVGTTTGDSFGTVLATGDYNQDGYGDVAVGAYGFNNADGDNGAVYFIYSYVDQDGDGVTGIDGVNDGTDCDDTDSTVSQNQTYYQDNDEDGYGTTAATIELCESTAPQGFADNADDANDNDADNDGVEKDADCNDEDSTVSTEQTYYVDEDLDGLGSDETALVCSSTATSGYSTNSDDEDDTVANLSYERAGDNADNDGDGIVDEDNTLAENGVHTGYDSLDPNSTSDAVATLTRVKGRKQGKIRVTYSDQSSYIYTIFTDSVRRKTKVKQYDDLGYYVVYQANGKKVALVNAYTGEVYNRKAVNRKARRYAGLLLADVRGDGQVEAVVTNRKGSGVQVALFRVNTTTQKLKKRSSLKLTDATVNPTKTRKKRNQVLLRNGHSKVKHHLKTNSHYRLSLTN